LCLLERKDRGAEDKPCLQETRKPNSDSQELQHESSPFRNLLHTRCVLYVLDNVCIVHLHNKAYTVHAPDCVSRQKSAVAVALVVICIRQARVRILARDPLHAMGNGNSLWRVYDIKKGVLRKGHLTKLGFCKESNCSWVLVK
jgi:hypothetical protein